MLKQTQCVVRRVAPLAMAVSFSLAACGDDTTSRAVDDLIVESGPLSGGESGSLQEGDTLWALLPADVQEGFAACGLDGFLGQGDFVSLLSNDDLEIGIGGYGVDGRYLGGAGGDDILSDAIIDEIFAAPTPSAQRALACDNLRSRVVAGDVTIPGTYTTAAGNTIVVDDQGRVRRRRAKVIESTVTGQVVDIAYGIPGPASTLEQQAYADVLAAKHPELAALIAATPGVLAGLESEHLTLLAPTPAAFAKLPPGRYAALMANAALRLEVLKRHVIATPALRLHENANFVDLNAQKINIQGGGFFEPTINQMSYTYQPTFADGVIIYAVDGVFGETATYWEELNAGFAGN